MGSIRSARSPWHKFLLLVSACLAHTLTYGQEWTAVIDLEINHSQYGYQSIEQADLTFSDIGVSGSSETNRMSFTISGTYPMSGDLALAIYGVAWAPYNTNDPESTPVSGSYSANYQTPCVRKGFHLFKPNSNLSVTIWIQIFPRMEISSFLQECDILTLTSNTCSTSFLWEVSDNISGGFRAIQGKSTSTITITRQDLRTLGFTNPHGRKYFRVKGEHNPTSQLQPVDVYYPGPVLTLTPGNPSCKGASDGSIAVDVESRLPSIIDDFVVTLLNTTSGDPLDQKFITDANHVSFANLSHGTYTVKVENNTSISTYGSCWSEQSFAVVDPAPVVISSAQTSNFNGFQVSCFGATDGSIEVNASGGTGTFLSYEWLPKVSTSRIVQHLPAGAYQVRVKDSNGCWSDRYEYLITQPEELGIHLLSTGGGNGFDVTCQSTADGEIYTEVNGGVTPYRYMWSDAAITPVRSNLTAGTYSVAVTDANGCSASNEIRLIAPEPLSFVLEQTSGLHCPGDRTGMLQVRNITNATGSVRIQWSTGETGMEIINKPAGVYTVTVTDEQGCNAAMSHELEEPPHYTTELAPTSNYNGAAISCYGADDGEVTIRLYGLDQEAVSADLYTWYRNDVEILSGPSAATATNLSAGTYTIVARYNTFCEVVATLSLHEPDPVTVNISNISDFNGSLISCAGASDGHLRAVAWGGTEEITFRWNNHVDSADLYDIGAGTYQVTATDLNGCTTTLEKQIIAPDTLTTAIIQRSSLACHGDANAKLEATVTGGVTPYHYKWSIGGDSAQIDNVAPGDYSVTTTDANGCTALAGITVAEPEAVTVAIAERSDFNGFGVSCSGATDGYLLAQGKGGTGSYHYLWNGSETQQPFHSSLPAGTYRVIIADTNGCTDSAEVLISEPPMLVLDIIHSKNISCNAGDDGEILLGGRGGTGAFEYGLGSSWQSNPRITRLTAGKYRTYLRDANGCTATTTHVLTEPSALAVHFRDQEPSLCGEPTGQVSSVVSGGIEPYQFEWTDSEGRVIGHDKTINEQYPGIFSVQVWDEHGCIVKESVGIPSIDGPRVERLNAKPTTCSYSSDGSATLEVSGAAPFRFEWPHGETLREIDNLSAGTYLVEIADANNCLTVETVTISGPDKLVVDVERYTMPECYSDCNGRLIVSATGGNGNYTYTWQNGTGPSLRNICAGKYTVTVSDEKQCTTTQTFELSQPPPITSHLLRLEPPACPQDCNASIEIEASGGTGDLRYQWSNGRNVPVVTNLCAGEQRVTISDENGCTSEATYTLKDPLAPTLELGSPIVMCSGQKHMLDPGTGWTHYDWGSNHGHQSFGRWLEITASGTYWLSATDGRGCVARDTFQVDTSDDLLEANFLLTSEAYVMDTVVAIDISWPMPETVRWTLPAQMRRLADTGDVLYGQFDDAGAYNFTLSVTLGQCKDELTKSVTIFDGETSDDPDGRLGHQPPFVQDFAIYPNPNDGNFDITISLQEQSPIVLTIFDVMSSRIIAQFRQHGNANYTKRIALGPLTAGTYTVRLDHRKGSTYRRMIVR